MSLVRTNIVDVIDLTRASSAIVSKPERGKAIVRDNEAIFFSLVRVSSTARLSGS